MFIEVVSGVCVCVLNDGSDVHENFPKRQSTISLSGPAYSYIHTEMSA